MTAAREAARGALPIGAYDRDDALVARAREEGRGQLAVYRVERPLVVLGRGSRPERELDLASCLEDGVPVLRRPGGGCAVVLDPGNVIVSLAAPLGGGDERRIGLRDTGRLIRNLADWLAAGLGAIGIEGIERRGTSDLVQGERKVSGSCLHRSRELLHFSASLLVAPRLELLSRYLAHPPREPDYRAGRPHEAFVGPLVDPRQRDAAAIASGLRGVLTIPDLPGA